MTNSSTTLLNLDMFPTTPDEAVELTIHHLRLAAMFFMNTPDDDGAALREEFSRLRRRQNIHEKLPEEYVSSSDFGIKMFIDEMTKQFKDITNE